MSKSPGPRSPSGRPTADRRARGGLAREPVRRYASGKLRTSVMSKSPGPRSPSGRPAADRRAPGGLAREPVPDTRARHWPGRTRAGAAAGAGARPPRSRGRGARRRSAPGRPNPRARMPAGGASPARWTSIQSASSPAPGPAGVPVPDVLLIRTRTRPWRRQKSVSAGSGRRAVSTAGRPARIVSSRTGGPSAAGYQRVGDQAAGPQRGGDAGRQEAPRGLLQGAGLQPGGGSGAHELADGVVADGGGQGDPADGGGAVLAAGHRPADPDGLFDQRPGVRAAFGLVAGQQAGPGPAGQHVREFPGQVVGVAQPGGQALADERRGEMGGVAEQEDAAGLEAGRQPGPERVAGGADDLQAGQVVASGPGPQQRRRGPRG